MSIRCGSPRAGCRGHRSLYRDDADYGGVVALIRRRIQELKLNPPKQKWTRGEKIALAGVIIAALAALVKWLMP